MRFSPALLEEVLARTDLVALVAKRVKLTRKGGAFWGCCPFHKEKSGSFKVENARRAYKCFGCGKGGDAFRWLMEVEGATFVEAVNRLAADAGVELPKWSAADDARVQMKKTLAAAAEIACVFFEAKLRDPDGRAARDYLRSRGLDGDVAKRFRLGYAPSTPRALADHLESEGVTVDDAIATGLIRPADGARVARDFFFNRITFPIADAGGRVVAFGARTLDAETKPKYINSPDTPIFSKGALLYHFAGARFAAVKAQTMVVVEGYLDVITLARGGIENVVAPLGTALTEDQLAVLWRTVPEPILSFDGDEAGLRAAYRAARTATPLLRPGHSVRFVLLPGGHDPDSFVAAYGPPAFGKLAAAAAPLSEILWRAETQGKDLSTPERRAGLERALAEVVASIGDPKVRDYYRRDFEQRVAEAFKPQGSAPAPPAAWRAPSPVSSVAKSTAIARGGVAGARRVKEREIAGLLLRDPNIADRQSEVLAALELTDPWVAGVRRELLDGAARQAVGAAAAEILSHVDGELPGGDGEDLEARFLAAAAQLRGMAAAPPGRPPAA